VKEVNKSCTPFPFVSEDFHALFYLTFHGLASQESYTCSLGKLCFLGLYSVSIEKAVDDPCAFSNIR
jgi:hypothetical protein